MGGIVAAIDLGTTRTAYSYALRGNEEGAKEQVHLGVPGRLDDAGIGSERKTATSVLLEPSNSDLGGWRLRAFGDRARQDYIDEQLKGGGGRNLALFEHFKMALYRGGRSGVRGRMVNGVTGVAVDNKTKLPLVYVVSLALRYIKAQIIERLNQCDRTTISPPDIRWVLTVPAIWSDFNKKFMRTAAYRAGLIDNEHDYENLSLCLEPEAACLSVAFDDIQPWKVGMKLMVLNCGGGMVDITTHHVTSASPIELKELQEPTGGLWGSTAVDDKFKEFLKDLLQCSKANWETLIASPDMLNLMKDWEEEKTNFQRGKPIRLRMGDILDVIEMGVRTFEGIVKRKTNSSLKHGVSARKTVLTIGPEKVASLFEDTLEAILRKTKDVLTKEPGISAVYMVGGFSSNPLLQDKIADGVRELRREVKVVIPPRPGLAIVNGAALQRCKNTSIASRKARLTYGTRSKIPYNKWESEHIKRRSNVAHVRDTMYLDIFHSFVERGEDLPVGTTREHTFVPLTKDQKSVSFPITVSKRPAADIKYLKDAGVGRKVSTITTVEVELDLDVRFSRRGVLVRLSFGGTELHINCTRCSDGCVVPVKTTFVETMDEDTDETTA